MLDPFELVFTNIMFFYPAFRPMDSARHNEHRLRDILDESAAGGALGKRDLMIYLHIPFCRHICRFCGYHRRRLIHTALLSSYVDRLLAEMRRWSEVLDGPHQHVSHVYLGGGTPTLLSAKDLLRLVEALGKAFAISEDTEFDMESDVVALKVPRHLKLYKAAGVKRISFGVQSFDTRVQQLAGIHHGRENNALDRIMDLLRQSGFAINYDLMFGLPGQSVASFLRDIRKSAIEIAADHVDLLEFFPQPEAYFTRFFDKYKALTADCRTRKQMYSKAGEMLLGNGYVQHTLTDFWRAGLQPSPFKAMLFKDANILGLGAGSHGILSGCAYRNARLDEGYLKRPWDPRPLAFIRSLTPSLMRTRGLVLLPKLLSFCEGDIPGGLTEKERSLLRRFVAQGRLEQKKDAYRMTPSGLLSSAEMMLEVLRAEDA